MSETLLRPDNLFEISWEVCNHISGLHTVLRTKSISLVKEYENNYIVIGPDLVHESGENPEFIPDSQLLSTWRDEGRWQAIAQTEVCRKWWVHLGDVMPSNPDNSPVASALREVFHLD